MSLIFSLLLHAALLAAIGGLAFHVPREPESRVAAAMQNEAALAERDFELLEPVPVRPLEPQDPRDEPELEPLPHDELELLPLADETPPPEEPLAPLDPVDLPAKPPHLRMRAPPPPPAPAPPPPAAPSVAAQREELASEGDVIDEPEAEVRPTPAYPRRAVQLELEGTVVLLALVKADGTVEACEVESSSGHELLDEAARTALRKWRFKPRIVRGVPRPFTARVPFDFFIRPRGAGGS